MRIRPFEYHTADTLKGALEMIGDYSPEVSVLAGGTDLVLAMKHKERHPAHIVNLNKIKELAFTETKNGSIRIGALTRLADLGADAGLKENLPVLCEAVNLIGSWQIRNVATIGGNICTASPAADSASPLLALDARLVVADAGNETEIPLSSFFSGPGETRLKPDQIVKEIIIDRPKARSNGCYLKFMRKRAVDLSLAGVAFQAEVDEAGNKLVRLGVGLGGVAPTPIRAPEAEAMLIGLSCREALDKIPEAARAAVAATSPIDDIRASADYRRAIVEVFFQQAAEKVLKALCTE